jgi:integrase
MIGVQEIRRAIASAIQNHQPTSLSVSKGLTLRITATGLVFWQGRKRINGKLLSKSFGNYPQVSYRQAVNMNDSWVKELLAQNAVKPIVTETGYTFMDAYEDWASIKRRTAKSWDYIELRIRAHLLSEFGKIQLQDLTAPMIIAHLSPLDKEGKSETIKKLCTYIKQICVLAINTGRVDHIHDLTHINDAFVHKKAVHLAAVQPDELPDLFYRLENKPRVYGQTWALFMASWYTLARPGEISQLKWEWIKSDEHIIIMPAKIMKMGEPHVIPISRQLQSLLDNLPHNSDFVFTSPTRHGGFRPINKESVRLMLTKFGVNDRQSAHGIRAVGRTWMAIEHVPDKVAEACLAHATGSAVELTYKRYNYLAERREVMQKWCDYVDGCRNQAHLKINKAK